MVARGPKPVKVLRDHSFDPIHDSGDWDTPRSATGELELVLQPAASLPLAVYFQLSMPYPEVQKRAYAAALILTVIVLVASLGSRWISSRLGKNVIK